MNKHIHKFIDTKASSNSTRYTVWECSCGARKLVDV
jgi:hypothetical protein